PRGARDGDAERIAHAREVERLIGEIFTEARCCDGAVAHAPMLRILELVDWSRDIQRRRHSRNRVSRSREPQYVALRDVSSDGLLQRRIGENGARIESGKFELFYVARRLLAGGFGVRRVVYVLSPGGLEIDFSGTRSVDLESAEQRGFVRIVLAPGSDR